MAQNILLGITKTVQWHEVPNLIKKGAVFVDVRSEVERAGYGHIENSMHVDINNLYKEYDKIPKNKKIVVYCESGARSFNAEQILKAKGYDVYNLDGSYAIYSKGMKVL